MTITGLLNKLYKSINYYRLGNLSSKEITTQSDKWKVYSADVSWNYIHWTSEDIVTGIKLWIISNILHLTVNISRKSNTTNSSTQVFPQNQILKSFGKFVCNVQMCSFYSTTPRFCWTSHIILHIWNVDMFDLNIEYRTYTRHLVISYIQSYAYLIMF